MTQAIFPKKMPQVGQVIGIAMADGTDILTLETSVSRRYTRMSGTSACQIGLADNVLPDGAKLENIWFSAEGWTGQYKGKKISLNITVIS